MLYWTIMTSLIGGACGMFVYVYYMRKGQFEDPEDVKYQMFREDNEQ